MNQVFGRLATKNWMLPITMLSLFLGMLLAMTLNTQGAIKDQLGLQAGAQGGRLPWLMESLREQQRNNTKLKAEVSNLREQVETYESDIGNSSKLTAGLHDEIKDLKLLVGLTPVKGPGIIVTLRDNKPKGTLEEQTEEDVAFPDPRLVHDQDLRNLLNELFASGAEAVSINGHRVVTRTSVRCVGPVVQIDGEVVAEPFVVKAIGSPQQLESALMIGGGVVENFRLGGMGIKVKVERSNDIRLPAYTGPVSVRHARPVPSENQE